MVPYDQPEAGLVSAVCSWADCLLKGCCVGPRYAVALRHTAHAERERGCGARASGLGAMYCRHTDLVHSGYRLVSQLYSMWPLPFRTSSGM